jgi:hypothetical protein
MYLTSAHDLEPNINPEDGSLSDNSQVLLNKFPALNNMNQIRYDFKSLPKWADSGQMHGPKPYRMMNTGISYGI